MSKGFPALRYHGNKEAAVRHTKRGLYELFRTEELVKHLGVPVYTRSVEVSETTSIRVDIRKGETIVHIYSNVPELPEQIPFIEEEEREFIKCPSAFLIRKYPLTGGTERYADGYVIAYDHRNERWRVVKWEGENGPEAGNLGWYHVPTSSEINSYDECDVVTWAGQPLPDFQPTVIGGLSYPTDDDPLISATRYFYFQGNKYSSPSSTYYVMGACILKAGEDVNSPSNGPQSDYFYLHIADIDEGPHTSTNTHYYPTTDLIYRQKATDVLANKSNWELVKGFWNAPAEYPELNWTERNPDYNWQEFFHPLATDYIDKEGYAYYIRTFSGGDPSAYALPGQEPYTENQRVFIKTNLKTGSTEILNSSDMAKLTFTGGGWAENTLVGWRSDSRGNGHTAADNLSNPYTFYVFPGTQNLYTIDSYINLYHATNVPIVTEGGARANCSGNYNITFKVLKDGKVFREWGVNSFRYASAMEHFPIIAYDEDGNTYGTYYTIESTNNYSKSISLVHYHPEMPGITKYWETEVNAPGQTVSGRVDYYDGDKVTRYKTETASQTYPTNHGGTGALMMYGQAPNFHVYYGGNVVHSQRHGNIYWTTGDGGGVPFVDGVGFRAVRIPDKTYPSYSVQSPIERPTLGIGNAFRRGQAEDTRTTSNPASFWLRKYPIDYIGVQGVDDGAFAQAYAIHRPVKKNGQKPYLMLERTFNLNTGNAYNNNGYDYVFLRHMIGGIASDGDPADPSTTIYMETPTYVSGGHRYCGYGLWVEPTGSARDPINDPDREVLHWNESTWKLRSNFISAAMLNKITKEEDDNIFFDIGIL